MNERKKSPLSIIDGLIIIFGIYLLGNGLQALLYRPLLGIISLLPGGDTEINRLLISQIMQTGLIIVLIAFFLYGIRHQSFHDIGLKPLEQIRWLPLALIAGIFVYFITSIFLSILISIFPALAEPQHVSTVVDDAKTIWEIIAVIIAVAILAPIGEELLFRGYIYHSLSSYYSPVMSMGITSCMFAAMHFDLVRFLPLVLVGVLLNIVSLKSGSLYGSMVMHAAWNLVMIIGLLWI